MRSKVAGYRRLGVAVVGAGYWGPNLVRNFGANPQCELLWVCDLRPARAQEVVGHHSPVRVTDSLDTVLHDEDVQVVAIATPTQTHFPIAKAALLAGKHVLIEKPLAGSVAEAEALIELAERQRRVLMCDHTYCYTPAVRRICSLIADGSVGSLQYLDSVRINLGLIQKDVDVFWDLAPHDLSILDFVLPPECRPLAVAAHGADPIGVGRACVGYLTMPLSGGGIAHLHVNWLSPTKIRTTIIGGSRRMLVWDDLNPSQRLSLYDKGVELTEGLSPEMQRSVLVSYRSGDMIAPALPEQEALQGVVAELVAAIGEERRPLTDGQSGLRVLRILDAASRSLRANGAPIVLGGAELGVPTMAAAG
jgi:predicted dehydrogenase